MNKWLGIGRLTRDPDIRYTQGERSVCVAKFTVAVDRRTRKKDSNEQTADFIGCTAFGKTAEFVEKYVHKGTKVAIEGRIQTGNYTDKDGVKHYTTDVMVENMEFAESKAASGGGSGNSNATANAGTDDFMAIPDGITDEELPFN